MQTVHVPRFGAVEVILTRYGWTMTKRKRRTFWLIIKDADRGFFNVVGPMTDDRPWNDAVCEAQNRGRDVTCTASEKPLEPDEMIPLYAGQMGLRFTEELIVNPEDE